MPAFSDAVVIAGLGTICGLGTGVERLWEGLLAGRSAVGRIRAFDAEGFACPFGVEADAIDIREWVPKSYRKATKVMVRDTQLAVVAARLAADDADLRTRASDEGDTRPAVEGDRLGCMIGAGLIPSETEEMCRAVVAATDEQGRFSTRRWGTIESVEEVAAFERSVSRAWGPLSSSGCGGRLGGAPPSFDGAPTPDRLGQSGLNSVPPLWMLKYLPNMLACHVTIIHGAQGPSNTHTVAEASGMLSITEAARVIRRGAAGVCFAGGAESKITPMGLMRWQLAGRVAELSESARAGVDPGSLVRPFAWGSGEPGGGVLGEAGSLVMIESLEHARARGVERVYATVLGVGCGHWPRAVTYVDAAAGVSGGVPQADRGLVSAVRSALGRSGVGPDEIDAIVPTGLGVPGADASELCALREVFGDRLGEVTVVPITALVGNCVAGLSGLQVAAGALMLHNQWIPAPAGVLGDGVGSAVSGGGSSGVLSCAGAGGRSAALSRVLVTTSAFGGQSAAVVLGRAG